MRSSLPAVRATPAGRAPSKAAKVRVSVTPAAAPIPCPIAAAPVPASAAAAGIFAVGNAPFHGSIYFVEPSSTIRNAHNRSRGKLRRLNEASYCRQTRATRHRQPAGRLREKRSRGAR